MKLNLGDYRNDGVRLLSGRDRGEAVRRSLGLDQEDKKDSQVEVNIPGDIDSVSTSFFLGLFGPSVRKLGSREAFLLKYHFTCSPRLFEEDVLRGIHQALKTRIPL